MRYWICLIFCMSFLFCIIDKVSARYDEDEVKTWEFREYPYIEVKTSIDVNGIKELAEVIKKQGEDLKDTKKQFLDVFKSQLEALNKSFEKIASLDELSDKDRNAIINLVKAITNSADSLAESIAAASTELRKSVHGLGKVIKSSENSIPIVIGNSFAKAHVHTIKPMVKDLKDFFRNFFIVLFVFLGISISVLMLLGLPRVGKSIKQVTVDIKELTDNIAKTSESLLKIIEQLADAKKKVKQAFK